MSDHTKIEWTDATWNPIRARRRFAGPPGANGKPVPIGRLGWFCTHVSEGCRNCYAERLNGWRGTQIPFHPNRLQDVEIFLDEKVLEQPLHWRKPRRIFVCDMTDLFFERHRGDQQFAIFEMMARCPQHTFQVLTKRPRIMREWLTLPGWDKEENRKRCRWPLPNVWLGVSVENQGTADERIPLLLQTPAAVRWVSYEPALGPVDFSWWFCCKMEGHLHLPSLDWIVCGGESGPHARPMHPDWARSARDQCQAASVPFFFKQWGGVHKRKTGRLLDGCEWNEFPAVVGPARAACQSEKDRSAQ